jgi:hypothetical protein
LPHHLHQQRFGAGVLFRFLWYVSVVNTEISQHGQVVPTETDPNTKRAEEACKAGSDYEKSVSDALVAAGFGVMKHSEYKKGPPKEGFSDRLVVTNVPASDSNGQKGRGEFMLSVKRPLADPGKGRWTCRIECKRQMSSGSNSVKLTALRDICFERYSGEDVLCVIDFLPSEHDAVRRFADQIRGGLSADKHSGAFPLKRVGLMPLNFFATWMLAGFEDCLHNREHPFPIKEPEEKDGCTPPCLPTFTATALARLGSPRTKALAEAIVEHLVRNHKFHLFTYAQYLQIRDHKLRPSRLIVRNAIVQSPNGKRCNNDLFLDCDGREGPYAMRVRIICEQQHVHGSVDEKLNDIPERIFCAPQHYDALCVLSIPGARSTCFPALAERLDKKLVGHKTSNNPALARQRAGVVCMTRFIEWAEREFNPVQGGDFRAPGPLPLAKESITPLDQEIATIAYHAQKQKQKQKAAAGKTRTCVRPPAPLDPAQYQLL